MYGAVKDGVSRRVFAPHTNADYIRNEMEMVR